MSFYFTIQVLNIHLTDFIKGPINFNVILSLKCFGLNFRQSCVKTSSTVVKVMDKFFNKRYRT